MTFSEKGLCHLVYCNSKNWDLVLHGGIGFYQKIHEASEYLRVCSYGTSLHGKYIIREEGRQQHKGLKVLVRLRLRKSEIKLFISELI